MLSFQEFQSAWIWYKRYCDNRGVFIDMKRILSEVKRKGYLSLDDITQLTEINPNFLHSFAKYYKLTSKEVRRLASKKEITFNMVFEYIKIRYWIGLADWLHKLEITS